MIENIAVWDSVELANPIEHAIRKIWRPFPVKRVCQSHAFRDGGISGCDLL